MSVHPSSLSERTRATMSKHGGRGLLPINEEFAPLPPPRPAPITPPRPAGGWLSTPAKKMPSAGLREAPAKKIPGLMTPKMLAAQGVDDIAATPCPPRTPAPTTTPASPPAAPSRTRAFSLARSLSADSRLRKPPVRKRAPERDAAAAGLCAVKEEDVYEEKGWSERRGDLGGVVGRRPKINWCKVAAESGKEKALREKHLGAD